MRGNGRDTAENIHEFNASTTSLTKLQAVFYILPRLIGVIALLASCSLRPNQPSSMVQHTTVPSSIESTEAKQTLTQSPPIHTTLTALPDGPSAERSRIVLQAFFHAYNRHDLDGVLAMLVDAPVYGDCDFTNRRMHVFETKDDLQVWLKARFAEDDQFIVQEMIIGPSMGSPPNDPRSTAVEVLRTNTTLEAIGHQKRSLFKIVLNNEGNRINFINTYGNIDCEAGR